MDPTLRVKSFLMTIKEKLEDWEKTQPLKEKGAEKWLNLITAAYKC